LRKDSSGLVGSSILFSDVLHEQVMCLAEFCPCFITGVRVGGCTHILRLPAARPRFRAAGCCG
jgi:hypothetical protein